MEEHYDHPTGYWHHADENSGYGLVSQFERDCIHAWAKIVWELRSLVIDITGQLGSASELETRLDMNVAAVGQLLMPYYGSIAVAEFNTALLRVVHAILDIIKAIMANQDLVDLRIMCDAAISALGDMLHQINPTWWAAGTVAEIFTKMTNLYITQTQSRIAREWMTGITAADDIYNLMVGGNPDGSPGFADIFSQGIIQQASDNLVSQQSQ